MKVETFLPIFPGFYGTIYEAPDPYTDDKPEYVRNEKECDTDYSDYTDRMSKAVTANVESELSDFVHSITFQRLRSPKYYNFANDAIDVEIEPNVSAIRQYVADNYEAFAEFIRERYTSCSGFISHYSNSADTWVNEYTDRLTNFNNNAHHLGAILEFIAQNEGITDETIFPEDEYHIFGEADYSEAQDMIEQVRKWTQENYRTIDLDSLTVPEQFEDADEHVEVLQIIRDTFAQIENNASQLSL